MDNKEYIFKLNLLCVIKNIIVIICFTISSILFGKWWVMLFSALFLSSVERKDK